MDQYANLLAKVGQYNQILKNTQEYREVWQNELKDEICKELKNIKDTVGIEADIDVRSDLVNLEAIVFSLGRSKSAIAQKINDEESHPVVKFNGTLVYQQLFNGKLMVTIHYPFLEGLTKPKPPRMVEILRPEELTIPFISRHMEEFLKEIISWEDYDDDIPQKIGFQTEHMNGIIKEP